MGLSRPPAQDRDAGPDECTCADFSAERLLDVDGDRFFVLSNADTVDALAQVQANPLWQQLRAVRAAKVDIVELSHWLVGGIAQAEAVLSDLRAVLVAGAEPASGPIELTRPSS